MPCVVQRKFSPGLGSSFMSQFTAQRKRSTASITFAYQQLLAFAMCHFAPPNLQSRRPRKGDREVRRTLRHALRDAWPAMREFGWRLRQLCELDPADEHVGRLHVIWSDISDSQEVEGLRCRVSKKVPAALAAEVTTTRGRSS